MKLSASYNLLRASLMTRSTAASGSSFRMANATFCEGAGGKPSMVRAATASSSISECPVAAVAEVPETIPGYIGAARIVDETTARSEIQVPGVGSRDGVDYQLEERDGVLWINAKGSLYMDAAAAPTLFTGSGASYTTIQADGYARWYQVGDAAGKTMTVQVPENSGFWVYDGNGQVTASSVLWGDTTVTLPEDGTIVFAGDPGARFHLRFQG